MPASAGCGHAQDFEERLQRRRRGRRGRRTPTPKALAGAGLVGLLYFDLRSDTADTATLLAASWLATSRDGISWADSVVWSAFDMARRPTHAG